MKLLIFYIVTLTVSAASSLLITGTSGFKIDYAFNNINNYNYSTRFDGFESPILSFYSDEEKEHQLAKYHYGYQSLYYNILADSCRMQVRNKTSFSTNDSSLSDKITLLTQSSFWITKKEPSAEWYYLDDGQYYTYFDSLQVKDGSVFEGRYGAESFLFISDGLADSLIEYHNITDSNPYETLINNKEYALLNIYSEDGGFSKVSINNIIYTKYRKGVTSKEIYGDNFALIKYIDSYDKIFDLSLSISLKSNPYPSKKIVKTLRDIYSDTFDKYSFDVFEKVNDIYVLNANHTEELANALNNNYDIFYTVSFWILVIFGILGTCYLFNSLLYNHKTKLLDFIPLLISYLLIGLSFNFLYIYPGFSVFIVLQMVGLAITLIIRLTKAKPKNKQEGPHYEEITI